MSISTPYKTPFYSIDYDILESLRAELKGIFISKFTSGSYNSVYPTAIAIDYDCDYFNYKNLHISSSEEEYSSGEYICTGSVNFDYRMEESVIDYFNECINNEIENNYNEEEIDDNDYYNNYESAFPINNFTFEEFLHFEADEYASEACFEEELVSIEEDFKYCYRELLLEKLDEIADEIDEEDDKVMKLS